MTIEGFEEFQGQDLTINFQNEFLIAKWKSTSHNGKVKTELYNLNVSVHWVTSTIILCTSLKIHTTCVRCVLHFLIKNSHCPTKYITLYITHTSTRLLISGISFNTRFNINGWHGNWWTNSDWGSSLWTEGVNLGYTCPTTVDNTNSTESSGASSIRLSRNSVRTDWRLRTTQACISNMKLKLSETQSNWLNHFKL